MLTRLTQFITNHFKQPLEFYSRPWLIISLNIALSALILIFYEPFGYHFDSWAEFTQLIGFSVITFFSSVLFFLCIPQEPHVKVWMRHWNIGRNFLYSICFLLFTGIAISFYDFHLIMQHRAEDYGTHAFYICLLTDIIGTFTIGIVPLCVGLMLENSYHLKQDLLNMRKQQERISHQFSVDNSVTKTNLASDNASSNQDSESTTISFAEEINSKDSNQPKYETETILLTGDTKESLEVSPLLILLIEAAGNYVYVYYKETKQTRKIIRTTFSNMEKQLAKYPFLIKCHRTYMVNLNYITNLNKDSQGYHLILEGTSKEIPVSRTYLKEIKRILNM